MTDADRQEFALRITALGAARRAELTEAVFEALWLGLEDLSLEELSRAVESAIRQGGRWLPSAEELRQLAGQQPLDAKAIRAWNIMRQAIQRHGPYRTVDFDEPAINATVRTLGGWVRLCSTDTEEMDRYIRREFERIYRELSRTGVTDEEAAPVPGIFASHERVVPADAAPRRVITGLAPTAVMRISPASRPEGAPRALAAALAREKSSGEPVPIGVLLGPALRGGG
jgi:hypothetical protein